MDRQLRNFPYNYTTLLCDHSFIIIAMLGLQDFFHVDVANYCKPVYMYIKQKAMSSHVKKDGRKLVIKISKKSC